MSVLFISHKKNGRSVKRILYVFKEAFFGMISSEVESNRSAGLSEIVNTCTTGNSAISEKIMRTIYDALTRAIFFVLPVFIVSFPLWAQYTASVAFVFRMKIRLNASRTTNITIER